MTDHRPLSAVVLAAGEGTRMRSQRPKPLHNVCGRPMVMHVLHALVGLPVERTVVVIGHGGERVAKRVAEDSPPQLHVSFVEQRVQRGTGDAVLVGLSAFPDDDLDDTSTVVVLPGDTPLLRPETIAALVETHQETGAAATVLSARVADPTGYGRIVRDRHGRVTRIAEHRNATADERASDEINTGIYCFRRDLLGPSLRRLSPDNSQGECYLTDVVAVLARTGHRVSAMVAPDPEEAQGVNDRYQLATAERELRTRTNRRWMLAGVTMFDPLQTFVDVTVELGRDVTLLPGSILQGATVVGDGCEIGPGTRLVDCTIGADCRLEHVVARRATVGAGCSVGPYAVLEPGAQLPPGTTTGPFYTAAG
ncbi:MAG: bifunctional N-acetylglucosamine-1-phosphate uridyltransferase/glucosamine-1-phosphate acetyltransferase [Acidimicrobiales bacterium]